MEPILEIRNVNSFYRVGGSAFSKGRTVQVLKNINLTLYQGEVLGLVGESGSGKSTLAKSILGMTEYEGEILHHSRRPQMVFQDPYSSLNPRMCVADLIADPLKTFHMMSGEERKKRVFELMDMVGLSRRFTYSYPHELDGGRRQRIGVARALALDPKFIVCDEPVSALDVSIQAQILNLLQDLQEQHGLTYIFVTHDLSVVKHISTDILVMYIGSMVEKSPSKELFQKPLHPYTKGLLSAIPVPNIHHEKQEIVMTGELTSPINPKDECRFLARCPYATDICRSKAPTYEEVLPNHFVSCHNVREINGL